MDDGVGLLPVPGARFAELPVLSIRPNPRQPRTVFDEDALEELVGVDPRDRRPAADRGSSTRATATSSIMGERRWRATQLAGLRPVPAIVRDTDDADLLRDALLENLHRAQLNPLEEAAAYQQLLDDFGCTHERAARLASPGRGRRSRTPSGCSSCRRWSSAGSPPECCRPGTRGRCSACPDAAAQERLAQRIVAEGLSVRAVEEIVSLGGDPEQPARRAAPVAGQRNEAAGQPRRRGCPTGSRLASRSAWASRAAASRSSSRRSQDLNRILGSLAPEDPGLLRG